MRRYFISAAVAAVFALGVAGCGGGGTGLNPQLNNPAMPAPGTGNTIQSALPGILQPASSSQVDLLTDPFVPDVDVPDAATAQGPVSLAAVAAIAGSTKVVRSHASKVAPTAPAASAHARKPQANAVNSPLDLSYVGGPVLGSAISNPVYVNCDASCRSTQRLEPGVFLSDLGKDEYSLLLIQYLESPGELISPPISGRFTKGRGADVAFTPTSSDIVPGFTNPVLSIPDLLNILVGGIIETGGLDTAHNHIYDLFLPPNYDTCLDPNDTVCYSPDNPSAFAFCAYHSFATTQNGIPIYLTVIPDQGVPGCEPLINLPLPNQVGDNRREDSTDSTLSHETFETITDPQGDAWLNLFSGDEIGDLCAFLDNFVTINHHRYVIQSEYSDIGHECISARLTNPSVVTTPQ